MQYGSQYCLPEHGFSVEGFFFFCADNEVVTNKKRINSEIFLDMMKVCFFVKVLKSWQWAVL